MKKRNILREFSNRIVTNEKRTVQYTTVNGKFFKCARCHSLVSFLFYENETKYREI